METVMLEEDITLLSGKANFLDIGEDSQLNVRVYSHIKIYMGRFRSYEI